MSEFDRKAFLLWKLLDDIDTLDDACRSDDAMFRDSVRAVQQRRFQIMSGDEWDDLHKVHAPSPHKEGEDEQQ